MKKISFVICSFAAIGLVISALAAGQKQPPQSNPKTNVEQLTQEVSSLQTRIKTLEERLAKLEKDKAFKVVTFPPSTVHPFLNPVPAPVVADPNRPPNAWGEREFNGIKYYIMPLGTEGN